jgi:hypothetical protein
MYCQTNVYLAAGCLDETSKIETSTVTLRPNRYVYCDICPLFQYIPRIFHHPFTTTLYLTSTPDSVGSFCHCDICFLDCDIKTTVPKKHVYTMIMDFMWVPENGGHFVTVTLLYLECDIKTTVTSQHGYTMTMDFMCAVCPNLT